MLDVTISSDLILRDILGIKDLRSDKRIDFIGGIRGLEELKRRVDSGEMKVAPCSLSCFDETTYGYCRLGKPHAPQNDLVRTQATIGTGYTQTLLIH